MAAGQVLQHLRRRRRPEPVRTRRYARRPGSAGAGHPHLHGVEAALGGASARRAGCRRVLQERRRMAAGKLGAAHSRAGKGVGVSGLPPGRFSYHHDRALALRRESRLVRIR